jgi:hypothetical protein
MWRGMLRTGHRLLLLGLLGVMVLVVKALAKAEGTGHGSGEGSLADLIIPPAQADVPTCGEGCVGSGGPTCASSSSCGTSGSGCGGSTGSGGCGCSGCI